MRPGEYVQKRLDIWLATAGENKGIIERRQLESETADIVTEFGSVFFGLPKLQPGLEVGAVRPPAAFSNQAIVHNWPAARNIEELVSRRILRRVHRKVSWLPDAWWVSFAAENLSQLDNVSAILESEQPGAEVEFIAFGVSPRRLAPEERTDRPTTDAPSLPDYLKDIGLGTRLQLPGQSEGEGVTVAIVDTGFEPWHPQILSGLDSMGSATVGQPADGFTYGLEYLKVGNFANCHGTACAGIVAARLVSPDGPRGIAPKSKLRLIRLRYHAYDSTPYFAMALALAAGHDSLVLPGAAVISCSLQGDQSTGPSLVKVIDRCDRDQLGQGGAVICFASPYDKNSERGTGEWFSDPSILLVGTWILNSNNRREPIKELGSKGINLMAPNVASPTLRSDNKCNGFLTATSASTPMVAGAAALIAGHFPGLKATKIREALMKGTQLMPGQLDRNDIDNGWGRLDIAGALRKAKEDAFPSLAGSTSELTGGKRVDGDEPDGLSWIDE